MSGIEATYEIRRQAPETKVILARPGRLMARLVKEKKRSIG
jgi:hypothetical protein